MVAPTPKAGPESLPGSAASPVGVKSQNDTHHKALRINLEARFYGTLAEIGAGQEVAGWLFRVGGASGSVAKTMSAYDMQVSDQIYGSAPRYVSRQRLEKMLSHEYDLLVGRLAGQRGAETCFFAFANTVSARTYYGSNLCHGWLGLRFQAWPGGALNDVLLHINLRDVTNLQQQQVVGVLGINLIYAAFYQRAGLDSFLGSLLDGLSPDQVEVDFIEFNGPAFESVDNPLANLRLLRLGLALAVIFTPDNRLCAPVDVLYKRPIVIERGSFRSARPVFGRMLDVGCDHLGAESPGAAREPVSFLEISVANLLSKSPEEDGELLQRVDRLTGLGHHVMVSTFPENYQLSEYLIRFTREPIRLVMGIATLVQVFQEPYYAALDGGIMEAMGRLIARNVKIYAFSMEVERFTRRLAAFDVDLSCWQIPETGFVSVDNIEPASHLRHLYLYLRQVGAFIPILMTM